MATDDKINLAEATAGFTISGETNPNQELTIEFAGSSSSFTFEAGNTVTSAADGTWSLPVTAADISTLTASESTPGVGDKSFTAKMTLDQPQTIAVTLRALILRSTSTECP